MVRCPVGIGAGYRLGVPATGWTSRASGVARAYSEPVSLAKPGGKRALDKILDDGFVADLAAISLAELRERRLVVDKEEAWLSYLRRMLHGRIDILEANMAMRRDGRPVTDDSADVAALVSALAERMGSGLHGSDNPHAGRRAVEKLILKAGLDEYSSMSEPQLDARLDELRDMEREVSDVRHRVHKVHGMLTEELARRYRDGSVGAEVKGEGTR